MNQFYSYSIAKIKNIKNVNKATVGKCIITLLTIAIAMLGIFYTIFSDIIVQGNDGFIYPNTVEDFNDESTELDEFIVADNVQSATKFIFVIDISNSLEPRVPKPIWYNQSYINEINDFIADQTCSFNIDEYPTRFQLCKAKLAHLLIEYYDGVSDFTIWSVGDAANVYYPMDDSFIQLTRPNIRKALRKLKELQNTDLNTNISSLFDRLISNYDELIKAHTSQYLRPSYTLVILSDLIHDTERQLKSRINVQNESNYDIEMKELFDACRISLIKQIQKISNTDCITNVIVFSEILESYNKGKYKIPIWKYLSSMIDETRLNRIEIENYEDDYLYTKIKSKKSIKFYYDNPSFIEEAISRIKISKENSFKIGLGYDKINEFNTDFSLNYHTTDLKGDTVKSIPSLKGKLSVKGAVFPLPQLRTGEEIVLNFSGRIPPFNFTPNLKLYSPDSRIVYLVPIEFVKVMPWWGAAFIFMCWLIIFFVFFLILAYLFIYLFEKLFSHGSKIIVPNEDGVN